MAWIGAIVNALSCSDLYKYVFNSMRCKSDCCKHNLTCDCETDAIDSSVGHVSQLGHIY